MAFGAVASRFLAILIYFLAFLCSVVVLGIYSYFLATQRTHDASIPTVHKAIEGIGGAGVLYTLIAFIFVCFLGGFTFFAFLGVILNILFMGGFIAIAILTRDGASSCNNNPQKTPLGTGPPQSHVGRDGAVYAATLHTTCRLETVVFAVAVLGALFFLLAALVQFWLGRNHQREKRYGPSPTNGYTAGSGRGGFFKRRRAAKHHSKEVEAGAIPAGGLAHHHNGTHTDGRHSHGTATTDSYVGNKYEETQFAPATHTAGGYHTAPAGTGVNPYGYDNTRSHGVAV